MSKRKRASSSSKPSLIKQQPLLQENVFDLKTESYKYIAAALVLLLCLILYNRFIFGDDIYAYTDIGQDNVNVYWPVFHNLVDMISSGDFTHWNEHRGIGQSSAINIDTISDPFMLVFIAAGKANIPIMLVFVALLKILLSAFLMFKFLRYLRLNPNAVLIGTISYALSGYAVLWGQHYYFHSIYAWLPLLLLGAEQWVREGRFLWLVVGLAIIMMISFYFTFQFSIFFAIYTLVRYFSSPDKKLINSWRFIFSTIGLFLIGYGITAAIYLPKIYLILSSSRIGEENVSLGLLDSINYYYQAIFRFFSNNFTGVGDGFISQFIEKDPPIGRYTNYYEFPVLYAGLLNLMLIPQLLALSSGRERKLHIFLAGTVMLFILFPVFSYFFNAMSAIQYRWTFIVIIVEVLLATFALNVILTKGKISTRAVYTSLSVYIALLIAATYSSRGIFDLPQDKFDLVQENLLIVIGFLVAYSLIILGLGRSKLRKISLSLMILLFIIELLLMHYPTVNNREMLSKDYKTNGELYYDSSMQAINYLKSVDSSIYRIDKSYMSALYNDALIQDFRGFNAYLSVVTPSYLDYLDFYGKSNAIALQYATLTSRLSTRLPYMTTYLASKYHITKKNSIPTGYRVIEQFGDAIVAENSHFLPMIFTYDTLISREIVENLPLKQKEKYLLYYAMVDDNFPSQELPYAEDYFSEKPILQDGFASLGEISFIKNNYPKELRFDVPAAEGGLEFSMSKSFDEPLNATLNFRVQTSSNSKMRLIMYSSKANSDTSQIKTAWQNLPSADRALDISFEIPSGIDRVVFEFSRGAYLIRHFDFIVEKSSYTNDSDITEIAERRKQIFKLLSYKPDHIKGEIDLPNAAMLNFSIPYEKGWKLQVNGKVKEIHKINVGMMGAILEAGTNEIELKFRFPWINIGIIISLISITLLVVLIMLKRKSIKNANA